MPVDAGNHTLLEADPRAPIVDNTARLLDLNSPARRPTAVRTAPPRWRHQPWDDRLAGIHGTVLAVTVYAVAVTVAHVVGWLVAHDNTGGPALWPSAGLSVALLALLPVRRWPWVLGAVAAAACTNELVAAAGWGHATLAAAASVVEPVIAVVLLTAALATVGLSPVRTLARFLAVAAVIAPLTGALVAATAGGHVDGWITSVGTWWIRDAFAMVVVTPLVVAGTASTRHRRGRFEVATLGVAVAAVSATPFVASSPTLSWVWPLSVMPVLLWAGLRFAMRGVALAAAVTATGACLATALGHGPFATSTAAPTSTVASLKLLLIVAVVAGHVVAALVADLAQRDDAEQRLMHDATHDALTGLANRTKFTAETAAALATRNSRSATVAVLLVDLDNFKKINDTAGHLVGDQVLIVTAGRFAASIRPDDLVARLGGDEFVVLCRHVTDVDAAAMLAARLLDVISEPFQVGEREMHLSASIGVSVAPPGPEEVTGTSMLRHADLALYRTKRDGKAGVSVFDTHLALAETHRAELEAELVGAIDRNELHVEFHPVIDLRSGRVARFEALLRWQNRRFGRVDVTELIPLAEECGLIDCIGRWVLMAATRHAARWMSEPGCGDIGVAVNVSAREFDRRNVLDDIDAALHSSGLAGSLLCVELTEAALMRGDTTGGPAAELARVGVNVSVDDFGSGSSSLASLRRFPLDSLKIDPSFVAGLGHCDDAAAIVESVIGLAHGLGVDVIAEGVETCAQRDVLVRLGCRYAQGYLWSAPVPADVAVALAGTTFDVGPEVFGVDRRPHRHHPSRTTRRDRELPAPS